MQLEFSRLDIPFTTAFKHSSAVRTATQSVWVSARSDDVAGVGEGCPREYVTGESLASAQVFFADHQEVLRQGIDSVDTLAGWVDHHTALIDANPAAWCAVELAMLELFARREAVPVERVVGVPPTTGEFQYSAVVGDGGPDMLRATVTRYRALGFVDFKLKLSGDPIVDRDKIDTVRDVEHPERLRIRVDANNLWNDAETAVRHLQGLDYSFVGIEEPLAANAFDGMRLVSVRTGSPIILDESFLRVEQLAEITGDPERWIINVRVSKMGGLLRSLALVEAARNSGVSIIVGAQVGETSVLTRAGLIVARAAGRQAPRRARGGVWHPPAQSRRRDPSTDVRLGRYAERRCPRAVHEGWLGTDNPSRTGLRGATLCSRLSPRTSVTTATAGRDASADECHRLQL